MPRLMGEIPRNFKGKSKPRQSGARFTAPPRARAPGRLGVRERAPRGGACVRACVRAQRGVRPLAGASPCALGYCPYLRLARLVLFLSRLALALLAFLAVRLLHCLRFANPSGNRNRQAPPVNHCGAFKDCPLFRWIRQAPRNGARERQEKMGEKGADNENRIGLRRVNVGKLDGETFLRSPMLPLAHNQSAAGVNRCSLLPQDGGQVLCPRLWL